MSSFGTWGDVTVDLDDDFVATVEIHRSPNNFFDVDLIESLSDAFEALDGEAGCRAVVLCSEGKNFCAGAQFTPSGDRVTSGSGEDQVTKRLYTEAVRLFRSQTPVVAAVQGAAHRRRARPGHGGRLPGGRPPRPASAPTSPDWASTTASASPSPLPRVIGEQKASEMLFTGKRVKGDEAFAMGLADRLVPLERGARGGPRPGPRRSRCRRRWPSAPSGPPSAPTWPTAWPRPPTTSWPSRTACGSPTTGRRACGPCPSAARPTSPAREGGAGAAPSRPSPSRADGPAEGPPPHVSSRHHPPPAAGARRRPGSAGGCGPGAGPGPPGATMAPRTSSPVAHGWGEAEAHGGPAGRLHRHHLEPVAVDGRHGGLGGGGAAGQVAAQQHLGLRRGRRSCAR